MTGLVTAGGSLTSTTFLTQPPAPVVGHPGFKVEGGSPEAEANLDLVNSFSPGRHYVFPVDPANQNRMIIPPGPGTRCLYLADQARGGWTAAAIAAQEGILEADVTTAWIKGPANTEGYGLRSDKPLDVIGGTSIGFKMFREDFDIHQANAPYQKNDGPHHAFYAAGGTYSSGLQDTGVIPLGATPDPMHPNLIASFGTLNDGRAILTKDTTRVLNGPMPPENHVMMGWQTIGTAIITTNTGSENTLYVDNDYNTVNVKGMSIVGKTSSIANGEGNANLSLYACRFYRNYYDTPDNGNWWTSGGDRTDGFFGSYLPAFLEWAVIYDYCGWDQTYNFDGKTWDSGTYGQPPNNQGHDKYVTLAGKNTTSLGCVFARSGGNSSQQRSGEYSVLAIFAENQLNHNNSIGVTTIDCSDATGSFTNETMINTSKGNAEIGTNTTSFDNPINRAQIYYPMTAAQRAAADLEVGDVIQGQTSGHTATVTKVTHYGQFNAVAFNARVGLNWQNHTGFGGDNGAICAPYERWDGGFAGPGATIKYMIACNGNDPNHASDATTKHARTAAETTLKTLEDTLLDKITPGTDFSGAYKIANLQKYRVGNSSLDTGIGGIPVAMLNQATMGKWADNKAGSGNRTPWEALDYLNGLPDRCHQATGIWNWIADKFGAPQLGHAAGETMTFSPDPDFDGFVAWNPLNWQNGSGNPDILVDGDNLVIPAGEAPKDFRTFTAGSIAFGAGSSWTQYGGLLEIPVFTGTLNAKTELVGEIRLTGVPHTNPIVMENQGGRLRFDANATDFSGSVQGQGQVVILEGSTVTVPNGKTFSIEGADCRVLLDGDQGGTATLVVAAGATLHFIGGTAKVGSVEGFSPIKDELSGSYGYEDLTGGVVGQPVGDNLISSIVLEAGSNVTYATGGISSGTYPLTVLDSGSVTDQGANLQSGISLNTGNLEVTF